MSSKIVGTFVHSHDENLQEFMESRGKNFIHAKMICKSSPTVTISEDGGTYNLKTVLPIKKINWTFTLNEEVTLDTPDGIKKFIFTTEGDKLIQTPTEEDATLHGLKIVREFCDQGMLMMFVHEASGETGKRFFKRE